ncbi:MAG: DUF2237 domain-containing protein [Bacteroidetes bacterium]|nr:DUF2237 domain-containing protein [Bacteroidota bacterium]
MELNVLGGVLDLCCSDPMTGYFRDGFCNTDSTDTGSHTVCAVMTQEFLEFSINAGNDLSSPRPEYSFPGLKPGDCWCVCASRWLQAYNAGFACPIKLSSTHQNALQIIPLEVLMEHAQDLLS